MVLGNPESIKMRGWRQGSLLPEELVDKLRATQALDETYSKADFVLSISQDCDLVNGSYEAEPYVEVLLFSEVSEANGNLTHGKNPRRLHASDGTGKICVETSIHSRQKLDRRLLEDYSPALVSWNTPATVDIVRRWISRRYSRGAQPDSFNQRCRPGMPKVQASLKTNGRDFSGIYIGLSTFDELEEADEYSVVLVGTAPANLKDDSDRLPALLQAMDDIEEYLNSCEGIRVVETDVVGEDEFTLDDLRLFQKWDFDYLSLRDAEYNDIAPEA